MSMSGPLAGTKIIELAGIGAGTRAAMMLSDMGAEVICIDRTMASGLGIAVDPKYDLVRVVADRWPLTSRDRKAARRCCG